MRLFVGASILAGVSAVLPDKKPNFIFILSDDHGFSDVSWKNDKVKTPNMDKLRRRGMTIDGAYAQPTCTPSRVALLTGKYPFTIGFNGNVVQELAPGGIRPEEKLLPQYLKDVGYDTYGFGKWHVGYCDDELLPWNRGFDNYLGIMGPGHHYYDHQLKGVMDYWKKYSNMSGPEKMDSDLYSTDEFTKEAIKFLWQRQNGGNGNAFVSEKPFFMYMAYNAPHHPYQYPDHALVEEHLNLPKTRQDYLATLYRMDTMIGRLVDKLEQTGEMDNTYIVFQADNGPWEGGNAFPMRGKKSTWAEGGLRVPAFIVGPGITPDSELHRLDYIHLSDWLPTFLDLAGVDKSNWEELDGKSYKGVFLNNEQIPRKEMFHNGIVTRGGAIYRRGNIKLSYQTSYEKYTHTIPDEGPCPILDYDAPDDVDDIMKKSGNLQQSMSGPFPILMFDLEKDPYELHNICEEQRDECDNMVAYVKEYTNRYKDVKDVPTANARDSETINHPTFPSNSKWTTWGWCDAHKI